LDVQPVTDPPGFPVGALLEFRDGYREILDSEGRELALVAGRLKDRLFSELG
jgi:hypothetical protein